MSYLKKYIKKIIFRGVEYPTNRSDALEIESKYYFTDIKCRNGHNFPRYTRTGGCVRCRALTNSKWYQERIKAKIND